MQPKARRDNEAPRLKPTTFGRYDSWHAEAQPLAVLAEIDLAEIDGCDLGPSSVLTCEISRTGPPVLDVTVASMRKA